ncbi:MAG: ABC transporter permease, partial [Rhizobiaceae bacterium]|nr:ABC transporter permease [Rhizobiaceae bacterium]
MTLPTPKKTVLIAAESLPELSRRDLVEGLRRHELWLRFAVHDIKKRFRRSVLGPFWITLTMGITVAALGFVFSSIFQQDISNFLPYLSVGLIFWGFYTSVINESGETYIAAANQMKNVAAPISIYIYRTFARNVIILLHNMVIYLIVYALFIHTISWHYLLIIPGLIVFFANVFFASMIVAVVSARFRDIPIILTNVLQVVFFITPIFWDANLIKGKVVFIQLNYFYHLLQIVRAPLLGQAPAMLSWAMTSVAAVVAAALAVRLYRRAYP